VYEFELVINASTLGWYSPTKSCQVLKQVAIVLKNSHFPICQRGVTPNHDHDTVINAKKKRASFSRAFKNQQDSNQLKLFNFVVQNFMYYEENHIMSEGEYTQSS